ncbi:hypothetical protein DKX38_014275 [Salix brachista]|uniref:Uncharacterized protein n=1 Tax=Salix brachista TaxID=2182728 RepID=A0A5N5LGX1_9ROSI|nr:hypothetical protein DKX38_014275 [Salix brachista]
MAAVAQVSASLSLSIHDVSAVRSSRTCLPISRLPTSSFARNGTAFATGSPLLISRTSRQKKAAGRATFVSVRCEKSTREDSGVDVWIGRLAMVGFAGVIGVETAKERDFWSQFIQNFGLTAPLPTVALALVILNILKLHLLFIGSNVTIFENVRAMSIFICSKHFPSRSVVSNAYLRLVIFLSDAANRSEYMYKAQICSVRLSEDKEMESEPTPLISFGFNVETVVYKNISFTVWDVGGQQKVQAWYIQSSSATSGSGLDEGLDWLSNNISNEAT